jgi:hypothetical protein
MQQFLLDFSPKLVRVNADIGPHRSAIDWSMVHFYFTNRHTELTTTHKEKTMETTEFAKQTLKFQKTVFENSFNAMVMVQDQTEKMFNSYLDKLPWVTEDAKKTIESSADMAKKARDDFKKAVEDGFAKFEELLEEKE